MSFANDFVEKMKSAGKAAKTKTAEVTEVTKLKYKIGDINNQIRSSYEEIGKIVFAKYKEGKFLDSDVADNCGAIIKLEDELNELMAKVNSAKGGKTCPKCGTFVSKDSKFCQVCGTKIPDEVETVVETEAEVEAEVVEE